MTDPLSEQSVRDLLRSARSSEPMPADVAARLDDVLADLRQTPPAPVLPLHRRLAPRLLAAAAAVVLLAGAAFGVGRALRDEGSSASGSAASADRAQGSATRKAPTPTAPRAEAHKSVDGTLNGTAASLPTDAQLRTEARSLTSTQSLDTTGSFAARAACSAAHPTLAPGAVTKVVTLVGTPLLLVVGPADDSGRRSVEAWSCATGQRLRQLTLPAP